MNKKNNKYLLHTALCSAFATSVSTPHAEPLSDAHAAHYELHYGAAAQAGDAFLKSIADGVKASRGTLRQKVITAGFDETAENVNGVDTTVVDMIVSGISAHPEGVDHLEAHHDSDGAPHEEIDIFLGVLKQWYDANITTNKEQTLTTLQSQVQVQYPNWNPGDVGTVTNQTVPVTTSQGAQTGTLDLALLDTYVYDTPIGFALTTNQFAGTRTKLSLEKLNDQGNPTGVMLENIEYKVRSDNPTKPGLAVQQVDGNGTFVLPNNGRVELLHVDAGTYRLKLQMGTLTATSTITVTPKKILATLPQPTLAKKGNLVVASYGTAKLNGVSTEDPHVQLSATTKLPLKQDATDKNKYTWNAELTLTGKDAVNYSLTSNTRSFTAYIGQTATTGNASPNGLAANLTDMGLIFDSTGGAVLPTTPVGLFLQGSTALPANTYNVNVSDGTTTAPSTMYVFEPVPGSFAYAAQIDGLGLTLNNGTAVTVTMNEPGYSGTTTHTINVGITGLSSTGNTQIDGAISGIDTSPGILNQTFNLTYNGGAATPSPQANIIGGGGGNFSITGIAPDMNSGNVDVSTTIGGVTITESFNHTAAVPLTVTGSDLTWSGATVNLTVDTTGFTDGSYNLTLTDAGDPTNTVNVPGVNVSSNSFTVDLGAAGFILRPLQTVNITSTGAADFPDTLPVASELLINNLTIGANDVSGNLVGLGAAAAAEAGITVNVHEDINLNGVYDAGTDTLVGVPTGPTDGTGAFTINGLTPSTSYLIVATLGGTHYEEGFITAAGGGGGYVDLSSALGVDSIKYNHGSNTLTGRVDGLSGSTGNIDVDVDINFGGATTYSAVAVDGSGNFSIPLTTPALDDSGDDVTIDVTDTTNFLSQQQFLFKAGIGTGSHRVENIVVNTTTSTLTGTLVGPNANSQGITVGLDIDGNASSPTTTTDASGNFTLTGLGHLFGGETISLTIQDNPNVGNIQNAEQNYIVPF